MPVQFSSDGSPYIELSPKAVIRLEKDELNEKEKLKAEKELRETPEVVEEGLKALRQLIEDEPDFYFPDDVDYMTEFLRPCKYYAESAMDLMRRYYTFKIKHPAICQNVLPSKNRIAFEQGVISFMPKRDKFGRRILIIQAGKKWIPKDCSLWDMFKALQMALLAAMDEPKTQVNGVSCIIDLKGLSLTHVYQFTPNFAKLASGWVQDCVPLRLKGLHVINQPYLFNMLFAIFKPFLRQKLRKRIHFHGSDFTQLCEWLGEENLREDMGGTLEAPECDGIMLADLLCQYEDKFKLAETFGYKSKENL
ncbi:alpha-tocopherol transfer protein-like [Ctenocephalides felis]|uniref:alpha-tocopherol transfer protein-like n=1 Tax=Ctenocephalides felis TaxID=7515 RepID=UPI000E6E38E5|nr:alpha-tocopherol transfer protein-like [Ctenocephalides felis]